MLGPERVKAASCVAAMPGAGQSTAAAAGFIDHVCYTI